MKNNSNINSIGIGFCGLLTITFIVLKLVGVITWNWGWVLSPIWISLVLKVLIVTIIVLYQIKKEKNSYINKRKF